ncbi:hypothetical protein FHR47_002839 [Xanthomonas arboricola]|uniref:hypothetical protein n=1 Tax=Xanthomonas cannabis TaxID=1885674 RepID=UPI00161E7024|nr:hypothetical protein [Xanthomonas cannabis]MBB3802572.1 hypothetical protein [Xanthomonas cannabis]
MQTFNRWFPVEQVPEFLAGVFVLQHLTGAMTIVCDGNFGDEKLLVLRFEAFEAVTTYEEFSHRWLVQPGSSAPPKSPGSHWTFPFLQIEGSLWAAGSMHATTFGLTPTHYCILSAGDIVDVLAMEPPQIAWTTALEVESVMGAALELGAA